MDFSYSYKFNTDACLADLYAEVMTNQRVILDDIHNEANSKTPLKGGDLREQVSKEVDGETATIIWEVPYASYQERGMRADGTHVVKQYTTAGTGPNFARDAVLTVLADVEKYYNK